jgi:hypothetical protein
MSEGKLAFQRRTHVSADRVRRGDRRCRIDFDVSIDVIPQGANPSGSAPDSFLPQSASARLEPFRIAVAAPVHRRGGRHLPAAPVRRRGKSGPPALDSRSAVAWGDPYDSQESFRLTASAHGHNDRCGAGARCASGTDLLLLMITALTSRSRPGSPTAPTPHRAGAVEALQSRDGGVAAATRLVSAATRDRK